MILEFDRKMDCLYIFDTGIIGPVKIGFTNNPKRRKRALDCAHPQETKMIVFASAKKERRERQIHKILDSRRVNKKREFFNLGTEELDYLIAAKDDVESPAKELQKRCKHIIKRQRLEI